MLYKPIRFRLIIIKLYYNKPRDESQDANLEVIEEREPESVDENIIIVEMPSNFYPR